MGCSQLKLDSFSLNLSPHRVAPYRSTTEAPGLGVSNTFQSHELSFYQWPLLALPKTSVFALSGLYFWTLFYFSCTNHLKAPWRREPYFIRSQALISTLLHWVRATCPKCPHPDTHRRSKVSPGPVCFFYTTPTPGSPTSTLVHTWGDQVVFSALPQPVFVRQVLPALELSLSVEPSWWYFFFFLTRDRTHASCSGSTES